VNILVLVLLKGWLAMDKFLNMQMIMFGDYISITPQTDIILKLLNELKNDGFIPGILDIPSLDLKTGRMIVNNRMQFISPDRTWTIVFLNDRISVNYTFQKETKCYTQISELVMRAELIAKKVFSVFPNSVGHRLALNCQSTIENVTKHDLESFRKKFTIPFDTYNSTDYAEWNVRYNVRGKIKVNETETEDCNRIVELAQVENIDMSQNPPLQSNSIVLAIDVNTSVTSISPRFKYNNLLSFSTDAAQFISDFTKEIEER